MLLHTYRCLPVLLPLFLGASASAQTPAPTATAPALDITPLRKALLPLAGNGPIQSQSDFQMTGSKQGISFTFHESANIVAKRPGRFHADLTQMPADGSPPLRLTVISNGLKIWTYRPGTRQYSVTTYKAFEAANNDVTALGLAVGGFFIGEGHSLAQGFQGLTKSNTADVLTVLQGMGITLSSKAQSANGADDLVYHMALAKEALTYDFAVDSQTNTLRQVSLTGTQKSVHVTFQEKIKQITPQTALPKTAFEFTPPAGAIKVKSLSVDPF